MASVQSLTAFCFTHGKLAAITEVGNRLEGPDSNPEWWGQVLGAVSRSLGSNEADRLKIGVVWVLSWMNANWTETSVPFLPHRESTMEAQTAFRKLPYETAVLFAGQAW